MRSRKRAEFERASWPRKLSTLGTPGLRIPARSAASHRAPTSGSVRNASAMIGLMTDAGMASWKTAELSNASGR